MSIPLIDLSKLTHDSGAIRQSEINALDKACREIGFFYLTNTGISSELMAALMREAKRFFKQPQDVKNAIDIKNSVNHRGYGNIGEEQLDEIGHADWKETFDMALDLSPYHPQVARCPDLYGPNQYPNIEGFVQLVQQHYQLSLQVGLNILKAMALALGEAENFFSQYFTHPISVLRFIHYPPQQKSSNGAGAHTDYGCITLLYQDHIGGLQVRGRNGEWFDAPPVANSFVVNIGDLMQRWTNDCYQSTAHRVTSPTEQATRFSMPFFVEPDFDTPVSTLASCLAEGEPSPYPEITAGDWILSRFSDTYAYRNKGN